MISPDFSILIPTYNRLKLLKLSIASVLRQKKVTLEIIICDDSTNSDTSDYVHRICKKSIRYIKNRKRLGEGMNVQKCFHMAKGRYIFTLGDDDLLLHDYSLYLIKKSMNEYDPGMGKIGAIGYDHTIKKPYQIVDLGKKPIFLDPKTHSQILRKSVSFGIGYISGLVFNNKYIKRKWLRMDHKCYVHHTCRSYHDAAYDLIINHGIIYIPDIYIVGKLSLDQIPLFFNLKLLGKLFLEEPIIRAAKFLSTEDYIDYKKECIRQHIVLLPNIKYYTNISNYLQILFAITKLDWTILLNPLFYFWTLIGLLPNSVIEVFKKISIFLHKNNLDAKLSACKYENNVKEIEESVS
jgi:glycosyltransferase involved in cell wall biosynthesis